MATLQQSQPLDLPEDSQIRARAAGENFTVASRLLPRRARSHLLAFYGYARLIDQLGDDYGGDRLAALDWVAYELEEALVSPSRRGLHPLVAAAAASVEAIGTSPGPLRDLIEANRLDQTVTTYATWDDLLGYCRLSANPVGRLVLAAFGVSSDRARELSDEVCSGLQVAEHLQDVAEDALAGRTYLPRFDLGRFGVGDDELVDLARTPAPAPAPVRSLIAFEALRARRLLDGGSALLGLLRGRPRLAVAGFVAGGYAALDAIAANGYDPFNGSTRPAPARIAVHILRLLRAPSRAAG